MMTGNVAVSSLANSLGLFHQYLPARAPISGSSLDTHKSVNIPDSIAVSNVHLNKGLPPKSARFFLGSLLLPPLAGMIPKIFILYNRIEADGGCLQSSKGICDYLSLSRVCLDLIVEQLVYPKAFLNHLVTYPD